jgi:hypothetical protein
MTFKQLAKHAPKLLDWGGSIELISAPGRGKSTFTRELVAAQTAATGKPWGMATAFLGTYSPIDLPGFMIPTKDASGGYIADYTRPAWMRCDTGGTVFDYENGILLLDEFGQADPDVKKTSADLFLNKRVGKWVLPKGWSVWAASNRTNDRSGVTKSFDFVINRRMEVHIKDDVQSLEEWMMDHGVHPLIVAFMVQNPQVVFTDGVPDKQGPWMTPRSLVEAASLLRTFATDDEKLTVDGATTEYVAGLVGSGAALQLMSFLKLYDKLPTFSEVVADPGTAKKPDSPDAMMTICYALAGKVDAKTIDPVVTYMRRLPAEFAVTFVKAAVRRDGMLINATAMGNWLRSNASLVAAVAAARG